MCRESSSDDVEPDVPAGTHAVGKEEISNSANDGSPKACEKDRTLPANEDMQLNPLPRK